MWIYFIVIPSPAMSHLIALCLWLKFLTGWFLQMVQCKHHFIPLHQSFSLYTTIQYLLKQMCLLENQYISYRLTLLSDFVQTISSSLPRPASRDPPVREKVGGGVGLLDMQLGN